MKYRFKRNFFEKPWKARNFIEIRLHYFCTILYLVLQEIVSRFLIAELALYSFTYCLLNNKRCFVAKKYMYLLSLYSGSGGELYSGTILHIASYIAPLKEDYGIWILFTATSTSWNSQSWRSREIEKILVSTMGKVSTRSRAQQEDTASTSSHTYDSDRRRRQGGMVYIYRRGRRGR